MAGHRSQQSPEWEWLSGILLCPSDKGKPIERVVGIVPPTQREELYETAHPGISVGDLDRTADRSQQYDGVWRTR